MANRYFDSRGREVDSVGNAVDASGSSTGRTWDQLNEVSNPPRGRSYWQRTMDDLENFDADQRARFKVALDNHTKWVAEEELKEPKQKENSSKEKSNTSSSSSEYSSASSLSQQDSPEKSIERAIADITIFLAQAFIYTPYKAAESVFNERLNPKGSRQNDSFVNPIIAALTTVSVYALAGYGVTSYFEANEKRHAEYPALSVFSFERDNSLHINHSVDPVSKDAKFSANSSCNRTKGFFGSCEHIKTLESGELAGVKIVFSDPSTKAITSPLYYAGKRTSVSATCTTPVTSNGQYIQCDELTHYFVNNAAEAKKLADEINAPHTIFGIGITSNTMGEYIAINQMLESAPAHKAGLRTGDLIVSIDGQSTHNWTNDQFLEAIRNPDKGVALLTYQRNGETNTVSIAKENIIHGLGKYLSNRLLSWEEIRASVKPNKPNPPRMWRVLADTTLLFRHGETAITGEVKEGSCINGWPRLEHDFLFVAAYSSDNKQIKGYAHHSNFELFENQPSQPQCLAIFEENANAPPAPSRTPRHDTFWRVAANLNIRSEADVNSDIVKTLKQGSCVKMTGTAQSSFLQVAAVNIQNVEINGFASTRHLTPIAPGFIQAGECRAQFM